MIYKANGRNPRKELPQKYVGMLKGEIANNRAILKILDSDIAFKMGMSKSQFSQIINGRLHDLVNVIDIANALNCDVEIKFVQRI